MNVLVVAVAANAARTEASDSRKILFEDVTNLSVSESLSDIGPNVIFVDVILHPTRCTAVNRIDSLILCVCVGGRPGDF